MADLNNLLNDFNDSNNTKEDEDQDISITSEQNQGQQEDALQNDPPQNDYNGPIDREGGFLREEGQEEEENSDEANDFQNNIDINEINQPMDKDQLKGEEEEEDDDDDNHNYGEEDMEYTQLKQLWITEMSCPEIFPFDSETFDMHKNLLQGQEELVDQLLDSIATADTSNNVTSMRSSRSRNNTTKSKEDPNLTSLAASIYRMEADRVKFILADLARLRLSKIESHPLYMRNMVDRMSPQEIKYLISYGELLEKYLRKTVLNHMPREALRKLDEPHMIDTPDFDEYIFCKVMENVVISEGGNANADDEQEEDYNMGGPQEHEAGSSIIARYGLIKDLILEGKIQLLL